MQKEIYTLQEKQTSFTVTNSRVDAIRIKDITKTGYRVYENGFIGVSGIIGDADQAQLEKEAIQNLDLKIPYTCPLSSNKHCHLNQVEDETSPEQVLQDLEEVLEVAREKYSDFVLSNKLNIDEITTKLSNTQGLDLSHKTKNFSLQIFAREATSSNIFDTFVGGVWKKWDKETILKEMENTLCNYRNLLPLPTAKKLPILFSIDGDCALFDKFITDLNGNKIGKGVSIFSPYMGALKFNENFTLIQDNTGIMENPFFDAEGVVCENYHYALIEKGVLKAGYTDKQTATKFNLPLTGSASATYDEVPTLSASTFNIAHSNKNLKELLQGEVGLYIIAASGGDFTPDGNFASPVQLAMLTDGEKFLGRVPEFEISGHIFDLFGADYIGVSNNQPFMGLPTLAINMSIHSK